MPSWLSELRYRLHSVWVLLCCFLVGFRLLWSFRVMRNLSSNSFFQSRLHTPPQVCLALPRPPKIGATNSQMPAVTAEDLGTHTSTKDEAPTKEIYLFCTSGGAVCAGHAQVTLVESSNKARRTVPPPGAGSSSSAAGSSCHIRPPPPPPPYGWWQ